MLDRTNATVGWLVLMGIGFASAGGLWLFPRWVTAACVEAAGAAALHFF